MSSMKSVTEQGNLADFISSAELAQDDFESQRANTVVIESTAFVQVRAEPTEEQKEAQRDLWNSLQVPRRPRWTREMDAEELHEAERTSFIEWRRNLAQVEESERVMLTPFEKNLNVWRQLWRVVEMADILVQIVDARDPELFRCQDLERYVMEVGEGKKQCMLLLNKADLLTENQRQLWAEYYRSINVEFMFFSAKDEEKVEEGEREGDEDEERGDDSGDDDDDDDDSGDGDENDDDNDSANDGDGVVANNNNNNNTASHDQVTKEIEEEGPPRERRDFDIVRRSELIESLIARGKAMVRKDSSQPRVSIGFCGYPNVGKSSTINKLMEEKKVTVSATPGKTKHFQSLFLGDHIILLDCPGLVFPNFVTNKATMVCSGLLPIDELRDWRSPGSLVCQRITRSVLEAKYGVVLPQPDVTVYGQDANRPPTVDEFFGAYAFVRGFMGHAGAPNMARAARIILKDYVNGALRYVASPPGFEARFDCQEGQEAALDKKSVKIAALAASEGKVRVPTYVEPKAVPQVNSNLNAVSWGAKEQSRKKADGKAERKKKRGGRGKHRGDVEYPYGLPPDPVTYVLTPGGGGGGGGK